MVYELHPDAFERAAPLFEAAWFDRAFIDAVFEGGQVGRLFVDRPDRPTAALLARSYEYYVAGDSGSGELRHFIADAPAEAGIFADLFGYVPLTAGWQATLLADTPALETIERREFKFHSPEVLVGALPALPPGIAIVSMDRALAERTDAGLGEHIGNFWGGYDRFLADGFGFCAMDGGAIAGVAYAAGASRRFANISIFTVPPYRRRGLATLLATAFIRSCLERGLVPTWDADRDNEASAAIALRLGLREYPGFVQLSPAHASRLPLSRGRWGDGPGVDHNVLATWRPRI